VPRWTADPCRTPTRSPAVLRPRSTVAALTALPSPLPKRCHYCFMTVWKPPVMETQRGGHRPSHRRERYQSLFFFWFSNQQEARKQRSGRSLNEDSRDESTDKKRGIFFSWSRNRSFGKGPKKKDIADINLGGNLMLFRLQFQAFCRTQTSKVLMCP